MLRYQFADTGDTVDAKLIRVNLNSGYWEPASAMDASLSPVVWHIIDEAGNRRTLRRVGGQRAEPACRRRAATGAA